MQPSATAWSAPTMTPTDRQFSKDPGRRLAHLRQDASLTQQVVATHLGIAQQTLVHYEVGQLRLPVPHVPRLQRQHERLSHLPKAQQQAVLAMLDGVLQQA
ncbi:MAG: helix-turn-helix domain-containing protein [Gemmatimonadetes bacterium]|nr:helix-turn-helix domain-containing protein [Gemmatimonadota bacterium]